jgi:hypothetical protein
VDAYEEARREIEAVLEHTARSQETITYSELVGKVQAIPLEPDSKILAKILDEISTDQDAAGRGMLSAVVIHKTDDYLPGPGFFSLAETLGRDASDEVAFHAAELERVHRSFKR